MLLLLLLLLLGLGLLLMALEGRLLLRRSCRTSASAFSLTMTTPTASGRQTRLWVWTGNATLLSVVVRKRAVTGPYNVNGRTLHPVLDDMRIMTVLTSHQGVSPSSPSSRPAPDSLYPPNGAWTWKMS